jgi:3-oxoacyl-[acyl-carrier-protein] synthase III
MAPPRRRRWSARHRRGHDTEQAESVEARGDDELSLMAEAGLAAANEALAAVGREAKDVDAVICPATSMQRTYPCIAIKIQDALGIEGFGHDMSVACSSGTFGIISALNMTETGEKGLNLFLWRRLSGGIGVRREALTYARQCREKTYHAVRARPH